MNTIQVLDEVRFARRDRLSLEVEVLRLEELLQPPFNAKTTQPTRSHFHTLLLIEEGESSHHVDFESYRIGPGHLLIIPEGQVHAFDNARLISGSMALFTSGFLRRCGLRVSGLPDSSKYILQTGMHIQLGEISYDHTRHAFATLWNYTRSLSEGQFSDETITSALSLLIFTVAGLPETAATVVAQVPEDKLVSQFLELLEKHFRMKHQASAYAQMLGVSLRTLDRHLKTSQAQSARQAISVRILLEAKRLLTRQDTAIKNIAIELGFSEPQNFTRFFRAKTGLSPQAFRNTLDQ